MSKCPGEPKDVDVRISIGEDDIYCHISKIKIHRFGHRLNDVELIIETC